MNALPALLADGWAEALGTVVFLVIMFVFWLIQNLGKVMQQRPQRPVGPNQNPGQQNPGQQNAGQQGPAQGGLNDEIGEFLRKAAQRRQQQPAPPQPREPRAGQPVRAEVAGGRQPVPTEVALQRARQAAEAARKRGRPRQPVAPAQQPSRPQTAPRAHVKSPQSELVPLLDAADDRVQSRDRLTGEGPAGMGGVFAAARPGAAASAEGAAAVGLFAMLSNPSSVRQAIILSEILSRPVDRW
ncbi:MAG: hypothetical protein U1E05_10810 [Patescibacteria group bacterium]|nr:hypothetical protein [Patescibacteria group bacterium]